MAALAVAVPTWHGNPYKPPLLEHEPTVAVRVYHGTRTVAGAGGGVRVAVYDAEDIAASEGITA
jgi:hypothetical protein